MYKWSSSLFLYIFLYIGSERYIYIYIYIYRKYFLRNIQRDIFNLPLDILNIPIISVVDYKEKIGNYTKYLEKKSNRVGAKYLKITFRKWDMELRKFHKRKRRCEIFAPEKGDAKFIFNLVQSSSNGQNFFISALICTLFEALDSWLPELRNDI